MVPTECTKAVVPPNPSTGWSGAASLKWRRRGRKKKKQTNKTQHEHLAALPTMCWVLLESPTCRMPPCSRQGVTLASSGALPVPSCCGPVLEHPQPCCPAPALRQCPLWETAPVAKGGGVLKQQECPSSAHFPSGSGGERPAKPPSSWPPCRSAVPCSEEPQRGLNPCPCCCPAQKAGSIPVPQQSWGRQGEEW